MKLAKRVVALAVILGVPFLVIRATDRNGDATDSAPASNGDSAACAVEAAPAPIPATIRESSGIARTADGSLWTHNDGDEARLYRISASGAIEQTVSIEGVAATDIEDIDAGPCPGGSGECLWLADTGDNDGERSEVALLAVPAPTAGATSAHAKRFAFSYPEGPRDAEALAILPAGEAVIVTKGRDTPIDVYRVTTTGEGGAQRARAVARVAAEPGSSRDRLTGAGASEDGAWIAMRTNDALAVYRTDALLAGDASAPALTFDLRPLDESQGEGVDIAADGTVWLTSEGERGTPTLARLRCTLPQ